MHVLQLAEQLTQVIPDKYLVESQLVHYYLFYDVFQMQCKQGALH